MLAMQLVEACTRGNLAEVRHLLETEGMDPNAEFCSYSALYRAVKNGHVEVVRCLLAHGADPNRRASWSGDRVLRVACERESPEMVRLLLEAGADPDHRNNITGQTALMELAGSNKHIPLMKMLLEHGADIQAVCVLRGMTALAHACWRGTAKVVHFLITQGADVTVLDEESRCARDYIQKPNVARAFASALQARR